MDVVYICVEYKTSTTFLMAERDGICIYECHLFFPEVIRNHLYEGTVQLKDSLQPEVSIKEIEPSH